MFQRNLGNGGNTAFEIMNERADSSKQKLGLTLPSSL